MAIAEPTNGPLTNILAARHGHLAYDPAAVRALIRRFYEPLVEREAA